MKFIIAALALAGSSMALANSCPTQMKAIDAKLASNPTLSAADTTKVKQLRAELAFELSQLHGDRGLREAQGTGRAAGRDGTLRAIARAYAFRAAES